VLTVGVVPKSEASCPQYILMKFAYLKNELRKLICEKYEQPKMHTIFLRMSPYSYKINLITLPKKLYKPTFSILSEKFKRVSSFLND
jgi:hypothetical protein